MKTIARTTVCRDIQREIEEVGQTESLSLVANDHLKKCAGCETFYNEQLKLQQILSSLGTIEAPGDFDFRLRARLAGEKRGGAQPLTTINFSFGARSAAFAAVLLLIGSAFLFVALRPGRDNSLVAKQSAAGVKQEANQPQNPAPVAVVEKTGVAEPPVKGLVDSSVEPKSTKHAGQRGPGSAVVALGGINRGKTKDLGHSQAEMLRAEDLGADAGHSVFPIDATPQPLKVSLDNGRGSSKTISLPGVSFGSQRVLTQSTPPLMASSRGAW